MKRALSWVGSLGLLTLASCAVPETPTTHPHYQLRVAGSGVAAYRCRLELPDGLVFRWGGDPQQGFAWFTGKDSLADIVPLGRPADGGNRVDTLGIAQGDTIRLTLGISHRKGRWHKVAGVPRFRVALLVDGREVAAAQVPVRRGGAADSVATLVFPNPDK